MKKLGGFGSHLKSDIKNFPPLSAPKGLRELLKLDKIITKKKPKRKIVFLEQEFSCANLSMFPIPIGKSKFKLGINYLLGNGVAKIGRFNGWLQFYYTTEKGRKIIISIYKKWKNYLEQKEGSG